MMKIFIKTFVVLTLCTFFSKLSAQQIIRVKHDAPEGGDGSSWTLAYRNLQDAINAANVPLNDNDPATQIWVSAGTYLPTYDPVENNTPSTFSRDRTFYINKRVELYGGFNGTELNLNNRDWVTNKTILSGDLNGNGLDVNDVYHVILAVNAKTSILNGFTITGSNIYSATSSNVSVGGESINRSNGGGLYVSGTSNNLMVENCQFVSNRARTEGAAIKVQNGSRMIISECLFFDNKVTTGGSAAGGAMMILGNTTNVTINSSKFINNQSIAYGGALYNNLSTLNINNCLFYGNVSDNGGGAMQIVGAGNTTITGTTIYGNSATGSTGGGAIRFSSTDSKFKLYNSIIYGNTSTNNAQDIEGSPAAAFEIKNAITQAFSTANNTANNVQIGLDPKFISTDSEVAGFLRLESTSPAIAMGAVNLAVGTLDLDGKPRVFNNVVDLGAYQSEKTLPVELESFVLEKLINGAGLRWKVLSETNNKMFVIEWGTDGENFETIGIVQSAGDTKQAVSYSYIDNRFLQGDNYYKLSQIDKNGVSKTLGVKLVSLGLSAETVVVYPNPAKDMVSVKLASLPKEKLKLRLFSITGSVLLEKDVDKFQAEQGFDLQLSKFNAGIYILNIDLGNQIIEKKRLMIVK